MARTVRAARARSRPSSLSWARAGHLALFLALGTRIRDAMLMPPAAGQGQPYAARRPTTLTVQQSRSCGSMRLRSKEPLFPIARRVALALGSRDVVLLRAQRWVPLVASACLRDRASRARSRRATNGPTITFAAGDSNPGWGRVGEMA